jgi:TusA-related sulfurtransferase/predicted peroxiredoxin
MWRHEGVAAARPEGMAMETVTAVRTLNRVGKSITTFVVYDLVEELELLEEGDVIEVITDDSEPFLRDMAAWCRTTGHVLVSSQPQGKTRRFLIEKRHVAPKDSTLAMVISNPGLEELLSPLGFALAAALEGTRVALYFQGPAVRVLARGYHPKLKGWYRRPFSKLAAAGMAKAGHIPAQEKLRQLINLGATIYMCGPSRDRFLGPRATLEFEDLPVVEYLSFMAVMRDADIQLYL